MFGVILAFAIAIALTRAYAEYNDIALALFAALSAGVGVLLLFDWLTGRVKHWTQELYHARIYHVKELANALRGLSPSGLDFLRAKSLTELELITGPGDEPTIVSLRCAGGSVPVGFIGDYLEASAHTWPYLLAVRDAKKTEPLRDVWRGMDVEALAQRLTHKLIEDGIADSFNGRFAAMVKEKYTLEYIRQKYHVD